ncbi:uncharacterized protein LOC120710220 [Panicum virgatum]|uniref:uncharacterized protein LOC120710220 n=1 Tax=Panicum virgatum TaxID=38727 RepID=UPI0019D51F40|nr:uncharacterized protein LOC120710220 [Panicum virgatum]
MHVFDSDTTAQDQLKQPSCLHTSEQREKRRTKRSQKRREADGKGREADGKGRENQTKGAKNTIAGGDELWRQAALQSCGSFSHERSTWLRWKKRATKQTMSPMQLYYLISYLKLAWNLEVQMRLEHFGFVMVGTEALKLEKDDAGIGPKAAHELACRQVGGPLNLSYTLRDHKL